MQKTNKKMSNFKNQQLDFILCAIIFILLALGIVMVLSASAPSSLAKTGKSYSYAGKQLLSAVLGMIGMYILSKIDYRKYKKIYFLIYIVSVAVLFLVLIPGLGIEGNGARRWIAVPIINQFQPSEFTKIGLIIFFAGYLTEHKNDLRDFKKGFIIPLVYLMIPIATLYLVQNHLSASLIIGAVACIMMVIAGTRIMYFVIFGTIGGGGLLSYVIYKISSGASGSSFRLGRIVSFLDPWQDLTGTGWQVVQGLYAIGSGGLFGVGLGESKQKYLWLSEPQNDFILAVIAEELGFVGCLIIMILFGILIWRGALIAMKAPDTFGSLLAVGIVSLVAVQVVLNIAVVTSSMPNTGIPLPFFSYGGTALMFLLCSMRNIIKYFTSRIKSIKGGSYASNNSSSRNRWTYKSWNSDCK